LLLSFSRKAPLEEAESRKVAKLSGEEIYKRALKSTVFIIVNGASGSGFLIDKPQRYVLTNYHVIRNASQIRVCFPVYENGQLITELSRYKTFLNANQHFRSATIIEADESCDLALIQLESLPQASLPLRLAKKSPNPGQTVHSIGNPGGSEALWLDTSGTVRQVSRKKWESFGLGGALRHAAQIVETQLPTNAGDSGGPMVNEFCELVGVTQGFTPKAELISYSIDVSEVRHFVNNTHAKQASLFEEKISAAKEALASNDLEKARRHLVGARKIRPGDARLTSLEKQLKEIEAEIALREKEETNQFEKRIMAAKEALASNHLEKAKTELASARRIRPGDPRLTFLEKQLSDTETDLAFKHSVDEGNKQLANSEIGKALASFNKALRLRPQGSQIQETLSSVKMLLKAMETLHSAKKAFEKMKIDDAYSEAIQFRSIFSAGFRKNLEDDGRFKHVLEKLKEESRQVLWNLSDHLWNGAQEREPKVQDFLRKEEFVKAVEEAEKTAKTLKQAKEILEALKPFPEKGEMEKRNLQIDSLLGGVAKSVLKGNSRIALAKARTLIKEAKSELALAQKESGRLPNARAVFEKSLLHFELAGKNPEIRVDQEVSDAKKEIGKIAQMIRRVEEEKEKARKDAERKAKLEEEERKASPKLVLAKGFLKNAEAFAGNGNYKAAIAGYRVAAKRFQEIIDLYPMTMSGQEARELRRRVQKALDKLMQ
jgi:S1-C subfamily serine protease